MSVIINLPHAGGGGTVKLPWGIEMMSTADAELNKPVPVQALITRVDTSIMETQVDFLVGNVWDGLFKDFQNAIIDDGSHTLAQYTQHATTMHELFERCIKLTELDCSNWNTQYVTTFDAWLYGSGVQKIWLPSTFVFNGSSPSTRGPLGDTALAAGQTCDVYTEHADNTNLGGYVANGFTMHYNATYNDYLNA